MNIKEFNVDLYSLTMSEKKELPKFDFKVNQDYMLPDHALNVSMEGKLKVIFSVNSEGIPCMLYLDEKNNYHHVLNLINGSFIFLNGKAV